MADDFERWWKTVACDGFVILPAYHPKPQIDFCDEVVPILQARGLFRMDYEGTTLREHLGLARPALPALRKAGTDRAPVSEQAL